MKQSSITSFSLSSWLFLIVMLIILFGISYTPPGYLREQAEEKTKHEIKLLTAAVKTYIIHHGYPHQENYIGELNFAQNFSETLPSPDSEGKSSRQMFIDFKQNEFNLSNESIEQANAGETIVYDPYEQPYIFLFDSKNKNFIILSLGLDGEADLPKSKNLILPNSYDSSSKVNQDNITSLE